MESLPVIFRAEKSGDFKGQVTAVFPTLPHDYAGRYFTVYAHIGQHGAGSPGWYRETRAAKPDEFAPLLRELRGIYETGPDAVRLEVRQRMTPGHRAALARESRRACETLRKDPRGGPWIPARESV